MYGQTFRFRVQKQQWILCSVLCLRLPHSSSVKLQLEKGLSFMKKERKWNSYNLRRVIIHQARNTPLCFQVNVMLFEQVELKFNLADLEFAEHTHTHKPSHAGGKKKKKDLVACCCILSLGKCRRLYSSPDTWLPRASPCAQRSASKLGQVLVSQDVGHHKE